MLLSRLEVERFELGSILVVLRSCMAVIREQNVEGMEMSLGTQISNGGRRQVRCVE